MTLYFFVLQYLHVIGATVLLGTGAGIAFFMVRAHRSRDVFVIAGVARIVVTADFVFTATAVVVQPVTGYLLAKFLGYPIFDGWIGLSLILYGVTGAFWIPVVFMQIRMRNLAEAAVRDDWKFERVTTNSWRFENHRTGETLEGGFFP